MPIEGFDYKAFATELAKEAAEVLNSPDTNAAPEGLEDSDRKNIIDTVRKFCFMAGEALSNDTQLKFNAEQASLVTQFIGEWTFHKSIDLIKGQIPIQNRDAILQIIAANIFNTAKLAIIKNMPQDALINLVEDKVKQVYADELAKLVKKGALSQEQYDIAVNTSNLNEMVQKTQDEAVLNKAQNPSHQPNQADKKVLKLVALAIILKKLPKEKSDEILATIDKNDAQHVVNYMKMHNIEDKIDHNIIRKSLEEIKKFLPLAAEINTGKILKLHHRLISRTKPDKLSKIAINERENVKDFILDANFPAQEIFSPHVIKSLAASVEEKINDN